MLGYYIIDVRVSFKYEHIVLPCFKYKHSRFYGFKSEPRYYMVGVPVSFKYERTVLTCYKYEHTNI